MNRAIFFLCGLGTGILAFPLFSKNTIEKRTPSSTSLQTPSSTSLQTPSSTSLPLALEEFGMPSHGIDFIQRKSYALMYNREKRNALWAGEVLYPSQENPDHDHERVDRAKSHFKEDPSIDEKWRSKLKDYKGTGFDRGHLVPSADANSTQEEMNDTFFLSNISPQVALGFNRGYWALLERFLRKAASGFDRVHVYTGPLWLPKKDPDTEDFKVTYQVIGNSRTAVPTHFYKVALAVIQEKKYLAVFVLPNQPIDIHTPLEDFLVPLDAVERTTGVEFFPLLKRSDPNILPLCSRIKCVVQEFKKKIN